MIYISLKFIVGIIMFVVACFLCTWFSRLMSKKEKYSITYEYMPFKLVKDHSGEVQQSSWEELKTLGADGWEIAYNLDESYNSYFLILKRETFHQS